MDPLKQQVADEVAGATESMARARLQSLLGGTEFRRIDVLNSRIKVHTKSGPRYFLVKISEQI